MRGRLERGREPDRPAERAGRDAGDVRWRHAGRRHRPRRAARTNERRDALIAALGLVAPGQRPGVLEATPRPGPRRRRRRRLVDAVAAGGQARRSSSRRRPAALAGWIEHEARERGLDLGAGRRAGDRWPSGSAAFVTRGRRRAPPPDADRRRGARQARALPRTTAPITVDDVRALVAEASRASVWAFSRRRRRAPAGTALDLLDRLLDDDARSRSSSPSCTAGSASCSRSATGWRRANACRPRRRRWASPASSGPQTLAARRAAGRGRSSTAALDGAARARRDGQGRRRHGSGRRRSVGWRSAVGDRSRRSRARRRDGRQAERLSGASAVREDVSRRRTRPVPGRPGRSRWRTRTAFAQVEQLDQVRIDVQLRAVLAQPARDAEAQPLAPVGQPERRVEPGRDEPAAAGGASISKAGHGRDARRPTATRSA